MSKRLSCLKLDANGDTTRWCRQKETKEAQSTDDYGPGFQQVRLSGIVDTIMVNTAVPIDAETTDVSFAYSVRREADGSSPPAADAIIRDLEKQMNQDTGI